MKTNATKKLLSLLLSIVMVLALFPAQVFAADSSAPWYRLTAGDQNGNGHFGSSEPEAFVLTKEAYTNENFSFQVKFNSTVNDTRFRFVTKYVDDSNWCYVAYDGYQGNNHWFSEYKVNGSGSWPDVSGLPQVNEGDVLKFTGTYSGSSLNLTVENVTSKQSGTATLNHAGIKADVSGKLGFGAARWREAVSDVSVKDLVIGNKTYDAAAYEAMTVYQNKVGSWAAEETEPQPPQPPVGGKLWYRITTGSHNTNSHNYGDPNRNAPALALDQDRQITVGQTLTMTLNPSNNFGVFYNYHDDNNWLYVGYDPSSKWYYQYKINGAEQYPAIPGLPDPADGMVISVALDRETLAVTVNGTTVRVPNSKLLPFSETEALKNNGRFGVKTMETLEFTDVLLDTQDCMGDAWGFAADRDGQVLTGIRTEVRPVTGVVSDGDGAPVSGASVSIGSLHVTTDDRGEYRFDAVETGAQTLVVSKAGFAPFTANITVSASEENRKDVTLQRAADLDLSQFDSITDGAGMTVYIGKTFPVIARYVLADGTFFRANELAASYRKATINGRELTPETQVLSTGSDYREYQLTFRDGALSFTMKVKISVAGGNVTWAVTDIAKDAGCPLITTIDFPQLNLLSVSTADAGARFDGALMSSNTTQSGDRFITFDSGFNPGRSASYLYAFLSNGRLSGGLESNTTIEGDKRITCNMGTDTISLTSSPFYYEQGDRNGQKYANNHAGTQFPACEYPCIKIAMGGDLNGDGDIDWNDGALAYRDIMHMAYENEIVKELVNYRIVMNFASMAPDPFLQTADNVKKVFLATDGLPQALLLKGYGSEGHDSANSEYAHIADREGGVEDFRKLIQIAHDYNTQVGIHINAQEAYPEAKSFCPELIGGPNGSGNGWGWLDQSHVIDKHWDLASGARWKRLVQLYDRINGTSHLDLDWDKGEYVLNSRGTVDFTREQMKEEAESLPNNMDFIYLDVWYQDSWESREIANQINSLGWRFSTEFATSCEYDSTWQHWATEGSYGGAGMKGFNSDIIRFIRNDQRDSQVLNYPSYGGTADNPLLGGYQLNGFEGWGSQRDFGNYLITTFNDNLPTKFLQHYIVTDWENYPDGQSPVGNHEKQITLKNGEDTVVVTRNETQRSDNNIERTIRLNGRVVLNDVAYLLPWTDNQDGTQKLYHWNLDGGETTWELDPVWAAHETLTVYTLTDQGRVNPQTVTVTDGRITLNAEPATAYIVVPAPAVKTLKADFGEMDYVTDPGFNGYAGGAKLDGKDWTGDIADPSVTVELSVTEDQRLQFASPAKDVAVSTVIRNLIPGEHYVAEIYVQNDTDLPATLEVSTGSETVSVWAGRSFVKNYVRCDNKSAYSSMQRMQVSFVAESETAVLTLKRAAGEGKTYMDSIRIVQQELNNFQPDGSFRQDFESVVQGLYPFVLGPAQGVDDPRTHLAELHAPYTQYGWNDRIVDDVIEGNWSLKHHNQSTGIIYQTLPQNFRFEPGKIYTVEFDYQTGSDRAYAMVIGDGSNFQRPTDSQLLPITGGKTLDDGTVVGNTQHVTMLVQGAPSGNTWIGLYSPGGVAGGAFGQMDFILDNLVIRLDSTTVSVALSDNKLYLGETADILVNTGDPEGGIVSWDNSDPTVVSIADNKLLALKAGTATLVAHTTDGKQTQFHVSVLDADQLSLHGKSTVANTQETIGEGMDNGIAYAASDGNESTYWHSSWSSNPFTVSENNPAILKVDLGAPYALDGIRFLQRSSSPNGIVQRYSFRLLDADGNAVFTAEPANVASNLQQNSKWVQVLLDSPVENVRYIEFKILQGKNGFASLAELQGIYHITVTTQGAMDPVTVDMGKTAQAAVRPVPETSILKGLVWSSSDPTVFTVDQTGLVRGLKPGTATLTVSNAVGEVASTTVTVNGSLIEIVGSNMTLGNELSFNFFLRQADLADKNAYTVQITKFYADGRAPVVTVIPGEDLEVYNNDLYKVPFSDISAKEMTDDIHVVVLKDDVAVSEIFKDSVEKYALRILRKSSTKAPLKAVIVDMLNYGTEAQKYFKYHQDLLANANLTAEEKALSSDPIHAENIQVRGERYYGSNLNLGSNIALTVYFWDLTPDMYAEVSYKNHSNQEITFTVNSSSFIKFNDKISGIRIPTLVVADAQQPVTVTLYNGNGQQVGSAVDSIASYLTRTQALGDLGTAILKFSASAQTYFSVR